MTFVQSVTVDMYYYSNSLVITCAKPPRGAESASRTFQDVLGLGMQPLDEMPEPDLDVLLESLLEPPSSPHESVDSLLAIGSPLLSSSSAASTSGSEGEDCMQQSVAPTAAPKRKLFRAANEGQRKERRMQRNREAAATSRARKKALVETLQSQVEDLKAENDQLRLCLTRHGLMNETDNQLGQWPCVPQPAALCWNHSLKRSSKQPLPILVVSILFALTIVLRLTSSSEADGDSEYTAVHEMAAAEQHRARALLLRMAQAPAPRRDAACMRDRQCDRLMMRPPGCVGPAGLAPPLVAVACA